MVKAALLALSLVLAGTPSCLAQDSDGGFDQVNEVNGAAGDAKHDSEKTKQATSATLQAPGEDSPNPSTGLDTYGWGDSGESKRTGSNGSFSRTSLNGPLLPGQSSDGTAMFGRFSGAATGAPVGSSYYAPSNLSLQTQFGSGNKGFLPKTRLDSFVKQSGFDPKIYGDEGTFSIPPFNNFTDAHRIERGIEKTPGTNSRLNTGHRGELPSSWDYPAQ